MESGIRLVIWVSGIVIAAAGAWYIVTRMRRSWVVQTRENRRRRVEDALKLVFNLQHEGLPVDQYRLAVELDLTIEAIRELIRRLETLKLIRTDDTRVVLTKEGQRWALQVIRAHRLWEKYLADEARMPLQRIHTAAHRREHRLSVEEVDQLDAALGHPALDPHGDPIPSATGKLRNTKTRYPLVRLKAGQRGKIVHLEDEPPLVYAQLLAEGLFVGQKIRLVEKSPHRIVFTSGATRHSLARPIAENICVQIEGPAAQPALSGVSLSHLGHEVKAEIVAIDDRCQGLTRRRFLDLGLTPGTVIYPELENAFRDPRAYRVRGTLIALRSDQAAMIRVRPVPVVP
ncbi:MAG: metal-dependent transcriptional regulator [Anaerolineales bacterium]|nr:metal-dependent transcriptional regulator [Anaerolineales bacterium]